MLRVPEDEFFCLDDRESLLHSWMIFFGVLGGAQGGPEDEFVLLTIDRESLLNSWMMFSGVQGGAQGGPEDEGEVFDDKESRALYVSLPNLRCAVALNVSM